MGKCQNWTLTGLPCIGRNCYEMPYFIEDGETGYLLEDDDIETYAYNMYSLLYEERIKKNVVNRRNNYIRKYSWGAVVERFLEYMC